MAVTIKSSGPRGAKTYEVRVDGALYDYTDNAYAARKLAARARAEQRGGRLDRYANKRNPTKAQKREKAKKLSAKRRIAQALQNFVRKANPAAKGVVKATKVKGGWNVRVVDVRRNAGKRASAGWTVDAWHGGGGFFGTKKAAVAHAKRLREANRQAGNAGPVRVIRVASPDYMPPITHRGVRYR